MVVNLQSGHEIALQYDQREITPNISKAVMVLVHHTSSYCALQMYEVSFL